MNLPGVVVDLPTLTEKDINDIVNWAIPNDIDFIAASFVRKAADIENVRRVRLLFKNPQLRDGSVLIKSGQSVSINYGRAWSPI